MQMVIHLTMVVVFVAGFALLVSGKARANRSWTATLTPLASIIGSGFLVSVPLISGRVGLWAVPAIAILAAIAFCLGGAIRYNIRYGETLFQAKDGHEQLRSIEMLSHLVLIGAYFISVAYYLVLLSTFALKLFGAANPVVADAIASVFIVMICGVGAWKGLAGAEKAEKFTVSANLAAIAALLACLVVFGLDLPEGYNWVGDGSAGSTFDVDTVRFLMGLLIIVQGFETSRFMGELYDASTRIRAMRRAQFLSAIVYVAFFALMIPLYGSFTGTTDVTAVVSAIGEVSPWLPFLVIGGALASQFGAAVADSIGASGLIGDTSRNRISSSHGYILIGIVALVVVWETDVIAIISLASRAFALFYALQAIVAVLVARQRNDHARMAWHSVLALIAFAVTFFGLPAGG